MMGWQVLIAACLCGLAAASLCTEDNKEMVGRVVFGEAMGESDMGQLAVAYVIVNRVVHEAYPDTLNGVVYAKYNNGGNHEFNTLDNAQHNIMWTNAKKGNTATYKNAITAARKALCRTQQDPTSCAVNFCATNPCSALNSNKYWKVYCNPASPCPKKIGNHYFVCRKKAEKAEMCPRP